LPIETRKAKLQEPLKKPPGVIRLSAAFKEDVGKLLERALDLGLEGLIASAPAPGTRPASVPERGSRSRSFKSRNLLSADTPNRKEKHFGALLDGACEDKKLMFAGRVGSAFSDKLLRSLYSELKKIRINKYPVSICQQLIEPVLDSGLTAAEMKRWRWVKPTMVCQVKFTESTFYDRLRHPVFLGLSNGVSKFNDLGLRLTGQPVEQLAMDPARNPRTNPGSDTSVPKVVRFRAT
jgi:bifunctional non-homologous end joining protein LigD